VNQDRFEEFTPVSSFMKLVGLTDLINQSFKQYPQFSKITQTNMFNMAAEMLHTTFSEEELVQLVAFYSSPLGFKVRKTLPTIIAQVFQLVKDLLVQYSLTDNTTAKA